MLPGAGAAVRDSALAVIIPGDPTAEALATLCELGPGATCGISEHPDGVRHNRLVPVLARTVKRAA